MKLFSEGKHRGEYSVQDWEMSTLHSGSQIEESESVEELEMDWSERCTEQTFGLYGRNWGWDVLREQHQNMYII